MSLQRQRRKGASQLAANILSVVDRFAPDREWLDYGTILGDYSLMVDRFGIPFLPTQYMVLAPFKLEFIWMHTGPDGNNHQHEIRRPKHFDRLRPGDRVLVAWLTDQTDPCVIGAVRRADMDLYDGDGVEE